MGCADLENERKAALELFNEFVELVRTVVPTQA